MSPEELENRLEQLRAELRKEEASVASGTRPENPGRMKETRRTIARILTIMNEKGSGGEEKKE
jgi:large subunit ribosomal protein L29